MITVKKNGDSKSASELDAKMQQLLLELAQDYDPEKEKEVIRLYEKMTGFKSGCGICRNGREMFKKGVKQIIEGQTLEGLNAIKASRVALSVNLRRLAKKFGF